MVDGKAGVLPIDKGGGNGDSTVKTSLQPPFGNIVLPQGLPKMRENAFQQGCWGVFALLAPGFAKQYYI
jgi:hypothetical protein